MVLATILLAAPFGQAWAVHHTDDATVDLFVELGPRPSLVVAHVSGVDGFLESVPLIETAPGVYGGNWELPRTENYRVRFGALFGDGSEEVSDAVSLVDLGVPLSVFVSGTGTTLADVQTAEPQRRWGWGLVAAVTGLGAIGLVTVARRRDLPED